ncbi:hypothetical protein CA267_011860 [Alteromonas pelagimontana]|uniref:Fibronectin type III domain-containing protein n=1 Tax=Alteromonas pelagimontana TaxID=1858656 RepID=A0A6M4ME94_9ALTE|nr:hypothetical protein [Alteromonas pelagimontana]QJR81422.1 hypothetical protein CA267_011860 [Alteromonas pelagimontana]
MPITNLTTIFADGVVNIFWDLQNFPPIQGIQFYRNTANQLSGRGRLSPRVSNSDSFSDATVQSNNTYWFMFKITLEDGSTLNTEPEGEICIP